MKENKTTLMLISVIIIELLIICIFFFLTVEEMERPVVVDFRNETIEQKVAEYVDNQVEYYTYTLNGLKEYDEKSKAD